MTIFISNVAELGSFAVPVMVTPCSAAEVKAAVTQTWPGQQVTSLRAGVVAAVHRNGGMVGAMHSLHFNDAYAPVDFASGGGHGVCRA